MRVLKDPMGALTRELDAHPISSRALARATGVPASVIRGVRNGRSAHTRVDIWARLMCWLLRDRGVTKVEVPDE